MKSEDEKLDCLLRKWECHFPGGPGLEREVWQRIAQREETVSWFGEFPAWLSRPVLGPALAAILFLAAVLAGVGAAELRMSQSDALASVVQSQEQAYFESINPVAHAHQLNHR